MDYKCSYDTIKTALNPISTFKLSFKEYHNKKLKPVFDAQKGYFILTLYNLNYVEGQDVTQDDTQDDIQGDIQKTDELLIIELIKANNKITTKEIADKIGISPITVKRKIKKMPNVVYVGSGYSGHWEVIDNK